MNRLGSRPLSPWYAVTVFTVLYMLSLTDRFALALLAGPIIRDFQLSDTRFGALIGLNFVILYSIVSVPIAHLLDRQSRVRWTAVGVVLWCSCTILSAFAGNFTELAMARAGVALGEAVLTPAVISLIADWFPAEKRATPTAIYVGIGTLMNGGAFVVGAFAVDLATRWRAGGMSLDVWRIALLILGTPGFAVALLLVLTVREPARVTHRPVLTDTADGKPSDSFPRYIRDNWQFFAPFCLALGVGMSVGVAALTWTSVILQRNFGMTIAEAGYYFGSLAGPATALATFCWAIFATRLDRWRPHQGALLAMMTSITIGIVAATSIPWIEHSTAMVIAAVSMVIGSASFMVLSAACMQAIGPADRRARLMALCMLPLNLIGSGLGPLGPAWLASWWGADPGALKHGLVSYALIAGPVTILFLLLARPGFRRLALKASSAVRLD